MFATRLSIVWCFIFLVAASAVLRSTQSDGSYNITLIHVNDIHAHLDEFQPIGLDCDKEHDCVGGYARIKTKIDELRLKWPDSLLLDCGDEFQGTLFFSYYNGSSKISQTLNQIGFDAMVLGNHEFDNGDNHLGDFLANLTIPVLSANLVTDTPTLKSHVSPYRIFSKHKLAVIGLTTPETTGVSSPGPNTVFRDPATVLAEQVDAIKAASPGVERIIAITHIGYHEDLELARTSRGVSVILGGHSHTLVGSMPGAEGPYPTVVKNALGQDVLVTTSYRYGEYLGVLNVAFGASGMATRWEGEPIRMTQDIKQNAALQKQVQSWRKPFDDYGKTVIGRTTAPLSHVCQWQECTLGNLITDVMVEYRRSAGATVHGALFNSGGIRMTIPTGKITRGHIMTALPFNNVLLDMHLNGQELWNVFSSMVNHKSMGGHEINSFLQVSADFEIVYDPTKPIGARLLSVRVGGKPLVLHQRYTIAANDFLAAGGDFFFPDLGSKHSTGIAQLDEIVMKYVQTHNPFTPPILKRILSLSGKPELELSTMNEHPFPVEDGSWTSMAILAAAITFLVLGLEYINVRDGHR